MAKEDLKQFYENIALEITEGMKENNIPGLSIAIVAKEGILWSKGFGYRDETRSKKVTPDTVFMIGSLSKAYNVVAFLRLMQKGKIHLDDKLRDYYPEFNCQTRFGTEEVDKITFRHLLSHYAGLPHFTPMKPDGSKEYHTFNDYIVRINESWLMFPVGSRFSYSNAGFDLVAYVMQKVYNKSYPEFLKEEVYLPLGMNNSTALPEEALKTENHARGFIDNRQSTTEETKVPYLGAGAQWSSVCDMAKFLMMFFNDGKVNGEIFLEKSLLREIYTIPYAEEYERRKIGLGIGISKNKYGGLLELGFFGDGPGYVNAHRFYPELGVGFLLQVNQTHDIWQFLFKLTEKISQTLVKFKLGKIPEDIDITNEIQLPPVKELEEGKLERLAGRYISRMLDIELKMKDGQLTLPYKGDDIIITPHSETEFSSKSFPLIKFEFDIAGRPKTVRLIRKDGDITILDYDCGPMDSKGPNKETWIAHTNIYKHDFYGLVIYSMVIIKHGYLTLVTNYRNKVYQLSEYKENHFFTADGQIVIFENNRLLLPSITWIKDDISIEKINSIIREDPDDIHVKKDSLEALAFIYEAAEQKENLEQIKKIIFETYPESKE